MLITPSYFGHTKKVTANSCDFCKTNGTVYYGNKMNKLAFLDVFITYTEDRFKTYCLLEGNAESKEWIICYNTEQNSLMVIQTFINR